MKLPRLQLTAADSPRWFFRIRYPGHTNAVPVYLGFQKELSRKEAAKELRKKYDEITSLPPPEHTDDARLSPRMMFSALVEIFDRAHIEKKAKGTGNLYRMILDKAVKDFGEIKIEHIQLWHIQRFIDKLKDEDKGVAYRTLAKRVLSLIFNYARKNRILQLNPVEFAETGGGGPRYEKRAITSEEVKKIIEHLPSYAVLLLRLGVSTGMRVSELLGLSWQDVNLLTGEVTCRRKWYQGEFGDTKTQTAKRPYQAGEVVEDLRRRRSERPKDVWVFESSRRPGVPVTYGHVDALFRDAAKAVGIYTPGFGLHSLRRACVSHMMPVATSNEIRRLVGKASEASLDPYTVVSRERAQELVKHVQEKLLQ